MVKRESLQSLTGARGARLQNGPKMQKNLVPEAKIVEKTSVLRVLEAKIFEKTTVFRVLEFKIIEKTSVFRDLVRQRVSRESPSRPGASNSREN